MMKNKSFIIIIFLLFIIGIVMVSQKLNKAKIGKELRTIYYVSFINVDEAFKNNHITIYSSVPGKTNVQNIDGFKIHFVSNSTIYNNKTVNSYIYYHNYAVLLYCLSHHHSNKLLFKKIFEQLYLANPNPDFDLFIDKKFNLKALIDELNVNDSFSYKPSKDKWPEIMNNTINYFNE